VDLALAHDVLAVHDGLELLVRANERV